MAQAQPRGLHIDRWLTGLFTNRAATSTPFRYSYGRPIMFHDALIDGSNVEITPQNTLARRPGFPKFNSTNSLSGETPLGFFSAVLGGVLYDFLDTTVNVYLFTATTLTSIYTKTTTAQSRFLQVGNIVYWSDGTVNKKVTIDTQGNVTVANAGIVAPTAAPVIPSLNLSDGTNQWTHAWVPGYAYNNTTGSPQQFYLMAPTGEIFWSVVPAGTLRTSGTVPPSWSSVYQSFGSVVLDGTMTWTNCGAPASWAATTAYKKNAFSANNTPFNILNTVNSVGTTGVGSFANWSNVGTTWGCSNSSGHTGNSNTLQVTGLGFAIPTSATVLGVQVTFYRGANRSGCVSDNTVQLLKAGSAAGSNKAQSGFWPQISWNSYVVPASGGLKVSYGSNTDLWGTTLAATDINNSGFGVQIIATQASNATTTFGITADVNNNNVTIDVKVYYTVGSAGLTGTNYQSIVTDPFGFLQACSVAGTSGSSTPFSAANAIGATTSGDGGVSWVNIGTANQLPCQFSRTYAFGYQGAVGTYHLSTMSPTMTVQAPIVGTNVELQGAYSTDTQVNLDAIYRSVDGGALLFFDNTVNNNSSGGTWTFYDTALDNDLNFLQIGPIALANNPPLAGNTVMAYWMGRVWVLNGQYLYFSAGPDCINGDGSQAFPPANVFVLPSAGTALAATSQGLVVITASQVLVVLGGPQALTFWLQPLYSNFGVQNQNAVAQEGDEIVMFTSQAQMFALSPSGKNELGFNVAPTLAANFNPTTAYVTIHRAGQDQGLFITDGSTHVMRYNMNAESWDALATPTGGIGPIASIQTALGTQTLVSTIGTAIVGRSTTTFTDAGSAYAAYATIGSIMLSEPGEPLVYVEAIALTSVNVGSALAVSVLPNEISGSFTSIPGPAVNDPPQLPASSSITMNLWYWKTVASQVPQGVKHVQVKITMNSSDTVKNEIYTLAVLNPLGN